jgi:RNA polymerase sigma-70 factor (ECF subfamily)
VKRAETWTREGATPPVLRSYEAFFQETYRPLVALAVVLSGSRWAAEDLVQEALSDAHREWHQIGNTNYPEFWVRRVVANKAVSLIRRRAAEVRARSRLTDGRPQIASMPDDSEEVWDAVRRLPRRQAQAIALVYLDGYSVEDVGSILGCSEGTVKTHLHRGRAALAKTLSPEAES